MTVTLAPLTQQMDLIDDEDGNFLHVASVLPAPAHSVPLLRCGHNEVGLHYGSHVWSHVASQFHHSTWRQEQCDDLLYAAISTSI